eukprot:TCONS_00018714-protein
MKKMNVNFTLLSHVFLLVMFTHAQDDKSCTKEQENEESCKSVAFYLHYQKVTCLRKKTIEDLSKKKDTCDSMTGYCWYEKCQKGFTNSGFFPEVRPQCQCEEVSQNWCKHKIDHNKKRCLKLPNYDNYQHVTCLETKEVLLKAFSGCPFPETHCWYACQQEKYGQGDGKIQYDCACSDSMVVHVTQYLVFISLVVYAVFSNLF